MSDATRLRAPVVVAEEAGHDPDPLAALSYVSTPVVPFSDRDLSDLLLGARAFNAHHGITGRLLVLEGPGDRVARFFQWIEGAETAVEACFARIEADPRHARIEVLFRGGVLARRYPGWDMGLGRTAAAEVFEAAAR